MSSKYSQHNGYDKYKNTDSEGNTENRGKASYNSDGSLSRLDNYSPASGNSDNHHHEWLKQNGDGSYEYGHGEHKNH